MKNILILIFVFSQFLSYTQIRWESVNSPTGGKITCLAVDSTGVYFVGLLGDNIYLSTDKGDKWEQTSLSSSLFYQLKTDKDGNVFAIAELPTATPEAGIFIYVASSRYWTLINKGIASVFARQIAIAPNGDLYLATTGGVYKSNDRGNNWSLSALSGKFVRSIEANNNGIIFAGVDFEGIYKSTDNGSTWIKSGNIPINHYTFIYIDQSGTIFTVLYHAIDKYLRGIYRSTDDGNTWEKKDNGIIYPDISSIISIKPNTLICAGPKGIFYRTTNNGDTWEVTTQLSTASPISSLCRLPDNSILATSNGIGFIKSYDEGKTFQVIENNFKTLGIKSLVAFNNNEIIASSGTDVFKTSDNGSNWIVSSNGLSYGDKTNLFRTQTGKLYAFSYGYGLFQSLNSGFTWEYINTDTAGALSIPIIQKENGDLFAKSVAKDGLVRSTDGGTTWSHLNVQFYNVVSGLAEGPEGEIYATSFGNFYKTTDNGENWIIKEHVTNISTAIQAYSNYIFIASENSSLAISSDKGETWKEKNISNSMVKDLTITKDGKLLVAIPGVGVKMSTDKGQTWTTENDGISNLNISSFYNDGNDKIYLCTGDGIYLANLNPTGISSVTKIPDDYCLGQNYPNPFNPATRIQYSVISLPNGTVGNQFVSLKVYDVLGNEVATLVNEDKQPGIYEVSFDAQQTTSHQQLTSGVYFYQLRAGSFVQTKKMIVLK